MPRAALGTCSSSASAELLALLEDVVPSELGCWRGFTCTTDTAVKSLLHWIARLLPEKESGQHMLC